jgi:hypothetical protein
MIRSSLAAVAIVTLLAGCGRTPPPATIVEAEGVVRLDGRPLNKAQIRFVPLIDHGPLFVATGETDEAGRFKLTCNGQPGACAGENRVLVAEADIPRRFQGEGAQLELARYFQSLGGRPIPARYGDLTQSPLIVTVKAEQRDYPLDLTH